MYYTYNFFLACALIQEMPEKIQHNMHGNSTTTVLRNGPTMCIYLPLWIVRLITLSKKKTNLKNLSQCDYKGTHLPRLGLLAVSAAAYAETGLSGNE